MERAVLDGLFAAGLSIVAMGAGAGLLWLGAQLWKLVIVGLMVAEWVCDWLRDRGRNARRDFDRW